MGYKTTRAQFKKKSIKEPLSLAPINVRGGKTWFYMNRRRIEVVTQLREKDGTYVGTTIAEIPWSYILKAVDVYKRNLAK